MSREAFLARVRQAAQAGRQYRVRDVGDADESSGNAAVTDEPLEQMTRMVEAVGGHAQLVDNLDQARESLRALLRAHRPATALCWQHPLLDRLRLNDLLAELQIEELHLANLKAMDPAQRRRSVLAAGIGITSTTFAVAESGTLALVGGPGAERWASLLPPVHVAIIQREQILADLFDVFPRLTSGASDAMPSSVTFITGPSKTGDLELRLTTGVHGPGQWHVIIIR